MITKIYTYDPNNPYDCEDLQRVCEKYHIPLFSMFFRNSRKLSSVLKDFAKNWNRISEEDRDIINAYFMGESLWVDIKNKIELSKVE